NTIIALALMTLPPAASAARLTNEQITQLLQDKIRVVQHMALNPLLVKAVRRQNAQSLDAATIEQRDREWRSSGDEGPLKRALQSGDHAAVMRRFVDQDPALSGALLADNQGANVATYRLADDYWQGDEAEWERTYNRGEGQVYVSPIQLDEKTGAASTYVAAPVLDRGATIGVLVVGVNLGGSR
ncbi:MAG TPA: PDC sensor domain-containing protein, partial [Gammaproteobacteria bacterium]|nr:PDC sensor domain-containing protein [Gammaproteobacteria bacterium]